jgi:hypothetical protein
MLQELENTEDERGLIYSQLENLLEAAVVNIDHFEQLSRTGQTKRQLVACCEKILESVLSLLPFKVSIRGSRWFIFKPKIPNKFLGGP